MSEDEYNPERYDPERATYEFEDLAGPEEDDATEAEYLSRGMLEEGLWDGNEDYYGPEGEPDCPWPRKEAP